MIYCKVVLKLYLSIDMQRLNYFLFIISLFQFTFTNLEKSFAEGLQSFKLYNYFEFFRGCSGSNTPRILSSYRLIGRRRGLQWLILDLSHFFFVCDIMKVPRAALCAFKRRSELLYGRRLHRSTYLCITLKRS